MSKIEPPRVPAPPPSPGLPFWAVLVVAGAVLVVGLRGSTPSVAADGEAPGGVPWAERGAQVAAADPRGLDEALPLAANGHREAAASEGDAGGAADGAERAAGADPTDAKDPLGPFEPLLGPGGVRSLPHPDQGSAQEEGSFRGGLRHGPWIARWPDGAVRERGTYDEGRRVGGWEFFGPSGSLMTFVEYDAGERHGDWRAYAPDGTLVGEGEHRRNLRNGLWTLRYTDGRIKERGVYAQGLREGPWEFFDDLGTLTPRSGTYRAGIKID